jgi:hypothetical protein
MYTQHDAAGLRILQLLNQIDLRLKSVLVKRFNSYVTIYLRKLASITLINVLNPDEVVKAKKLTRLTPQKQQKLFFRRNDH